MRAKDMLSEEDLTPPNREDFLKLMADLRIACENSPTLERKWMLEMSKYIFHIVGDWHQRISEDNRKIDDRLNMLTSKTDTAWYTMDQRLQNQEGTVKLCLDLGNILKEMLKKELQGEAGRS